MKVYLPENKLFEKPEASLLNSPKLPAVVQKEDKRKSRRGSRSFSDLMEEIYKEELKRIKRNTSRINKQENRALDSNLKKGCTKIKTLKNHINKAS